MDGLFDKNAMQAIRRANEEARRLNHPHVAPEHILLGLMEDQGVKEVCPIAPDEIRRQIEQDTAPSQGPSPEGRLPMTPAAKKIIEAALGESRTLGHIPIRPEHILLGLLQSEDTVASQILRQCGLQVDTVREQIVRLGKDW